jgi:hypothetical protein
MTLAPQGRGQGEGCEGEGCEGEGAPQVPLSLATTGANASASCSKIERYEIP